MPLIRTTVAGGGSSSSGGGDKYPAEGRLTLTSGTPVTTADVTGAGTLYYALYNGNQIALYDGSSTWTTYTFTERSLSLTLTSGKNYDVFAYNNAGTVTLELSSAWTNDTTRADALTTQDGITVKSGATTRRWLGTIRASGTNTTEDSTSKRYVFNAYNRVHRFLRCHDSTISWTYNGTTFRAANANTTDGTGRFSFVLGDTGNLVIARNHTIDGTITGDTVLIGIGLDVTNANSGYLNGGISLVSGQLDLLIAWYQEYVSLGYHFLQRVEKSLNGNNFTIYGVSNTNKTGMEATIVM